MKSEGQLWAIRQLKEISAGSREAIEIIEATDPAAEHHALTVVVSINCRPLEKKEEGIPLRARERLRIQIPWNFPLGRPEVFFTHNRYGGFPHVQWGNSICLFQAPDVEWQAARGMFGFMQRLSEWLKAGAAGKLDPVGMPLHPPVAYPVANFRVVPRQNAPEPEDSYWSGYVEITRETTYVAELGRWIERTEEVPEVRLATAILLPTTMPFEYPETMLNLLVALIDRGVPLEIIRLTMTIGVLRTEAGKPAIFIIGAAMRGIAGGRRLQHLACWHIDAAQADKLRAAAIAATADNPIDEQAFYAWAFEAKVEWCRVLEDRPEIVERRDGMSAAAWWRGKRVTLLGCGAIGSAIAMMLAKAGVARLHLLDNGVVTPGILVRQGFRRDQIGYGKTDAVRITVEGADPGITVVPKHENIVSVLADDVKRAEMLDADVVIDATASATVAAAIETHFRHHPKPRPPFVSMVLGHNADMGLMTLTPGNSVGASLDIDRRTKLSLSGHAGGAKFLKEFWPTDPSRRELFQPEPGCSSPTFRGSYADVLALSAIMANVGAGWLREGCDLPRAHAIDLSHNSKKRPEVQLIWQPYLVLQDGIHGYEIRVTREAMAVILAWTRRSERTQNDRTETGGVLFGQVDEFLKVVWVDEVSGPPPDSHASPEAFVCGIEGVAALHQEKLTRSTGSVTFVGMWHTHPTALPTPSRTDLGAMQQLLGDKKAFQGRSFLMLIVGGTSKRPIISTGLFERGDYAPP
ncbi:ThiF family adenylyltransferase [Neorhizobium galegae]|uniref:ThiF family adenylyltransferase n=1 Tax=Neorhizobium galegae TaxID=399 RepID=UPI001F2488B0|nr:ThiF family adenylyltransferase [Neorhizobium galegae]UIK04765.1 ThiF family adenylyltransferase [Neorhizobium galegae]